MTQLAGELFKLKIGAPITHVPIAGPGPASPTWCRADPDGHHQPHGQTVELHRTGKIRILAVTSPERSRRARHSERDRSGMPGMIAQLFTGLFCGTHPKQIIDQVYQASQKTMEDAAMQRR